MQEDYTIFEEGTLPSLGKIYSKPVNPEFKIRSMTTVEEMRRLSPSNKPLKTLCEIIDDCIIKNEFGISVYDMCLADYQYLLHKLRVATYGSEYKLDVFCPFCGTKKTETIDIDSLEIFTFKDDILKLLEVDLPRTKKHVKLKIQTPRSIDAIELRKKEFIKKTPDSKVDQTLLFNLSSIIDSIDDEHYDTFQLENIIRSLPMADTNAILKNSAEFSNNMGVNTEITCNCEVCGNEFRSPFLITSEFYGPRS